jgi:hypothetical protein
MIAQEAKTLRIWSPLSGTLAAICQRAIIRVLKRVDASLSHFRQRMASGLLGQEPILQLRVTTPAL